MLDSELILFTEERALAPEEQGDVPIVVDYEGSPILCVKDVQTWREEFDTETEDAFALTVGTTRKVSKVSLYADNNDNNDDDAEESAETTTAAVAPVTVRAHGVNAGPAALKKPSKGTAGGMSVVKAPGKVGPGKAADVGVAKAGPSKVLDGKAEPSRMLNAKAGPSRASNVNAPATATFTKSALVKRKWSDDDNAMERPKKSVKIDLAKFTFTRAK